jgi:hypothetical protein
MVEHTRPTPAAWRLIPEARGGRQDCQMQRHERFSKFGKSPARADPRSHQLDRGPGRVPGVPRVPGRRAGVREGLLYPHADGGPARGGPARRRYREHLLVAGPVRQRASRTLLARSGGPGLRWSRRGSSHPVRAVGIEAFPRASWRASPLPGVSHAHTVAGVALKYGIVLMAKAPVSVPGIHESTCDSAGNRVRSAVWKTSGAAAGRGDGSDDGPAGREAYP